MSELVGRFLSFEEDLGRDLVKFVYYVLLFLLVVTTLYDLVVAVIDMFTARFWHNLGRFLVVIPLRFFITLLLLRVGAELVIAILSIDDNLREREPHGDVMSSGLNPMKAPLDESVLRGAEPDKRPENEDRAPAAMKATPDDPENGSPSGKSPEKKTAKTVTPEPGTAPKDASGSETDEDGS
jgi:hypothetical protein